MLQPDFAMAYDQHQLIYKQVSLLAQEKCKNFNNIFGEFCNLIQVLFALQEILLSNIMTSQFQLITPMKKKIMNIFTSTQGGKTALVFLVVLAIYALIALVTYLVW